MEAVTRSRWAPVAAYTAVSAANQMLWLTYAPITTGAARHYGVSSSAIGWFAQLFPLVYVLLGIPAARLIDRDLSTWLRVGALLTAAGACIRLTDAYWPVLVGQLVVAVAQPLVLSAVIPVSQRFLAPRDRARGLAVSAAGVFGGMLIALVLGAVLDEHRIGTLVVVQAVLSVVAAASLTALVREPTGRVRARQGSDAVSAPLRTVWADPSLRLLIGLACLGFGVFVALTTWLQALLEPAGVSESTAGAMLVALVVAGVLGSAMLPPLLARRGWQLRFVLVSVIVGVLGLVALALVPGAVSATVVAVVLGALLLTDLPVILELVDARDATSAHGATEAASGGSAGGMVWLAGNAAGLVVAVAVQALVHHPAGAFVLLAVLLVAGLPLLRLLAARGSTADPSAQLAHGGA